MRAMRYANRPCACLPAVSVCSLVLSLGLTLLLGLAGCGGESGQQGSAEEGREQLEQHQMEYNVLIDSLERLTEEHMQAQRELYGDSADARGALEKLQALEERILVLTGELNQMERTVKNLRTANSKVKREKKQLIEQLEQLQNSFQAERQEYKETIEELETRIKLLESTVEGLSEEKGLLQDKLASKQDSLELAEKQYRLERCRKLKQDADNYLVQANQQELPWMLDRKLRKDKRIPNRLKDELRAKCSLYRLALLKYSATLNMDCAGAEGVMQDIQQNMQDFRCQEAGVVWEPDQQ